MVAFQLVNLKKKPILLAEDPFTGLIHRVRVIAWDRQRKVATVIAGGATQHTIPFAYFCWVQCGEDKLAA